MVTPLDTEMRAAASELIAEVGTNATITLESGAYDPATGEITTSSLAAHTVKVSPPSAYRAEYVDGDTIMRDDAEITIPAADISFTPVPGMQVEIYGKKFEAVRVNEIASGDQIAAYEIQLRG